jgi:hypothetical protein
LYSYGYPQIIKDTKSNKNNSERFYYIQKNAFYAIVQLLTEYQKKLIIKSVFEKYGITIELHQIEKMHLSSLACDLYLTHDGNDSVVKGLVRKELLNKNPMKIDFKANVQELGFLEHFSYENHFESNSKWKLLYRASVDGFRATDFHRKCDGKPNTVSIIKTTDDFVFGGWYLGLISGQ